MKRRSVLKGVSTGLGFGVGRGAADPGASNGADPDPSTDDNRDARRPARASFGGDGTEGSRGEDREEPWYEFSFRSVAQRMDPVRPITRVRGGYSPPGDEQLREWVDGEYVPSLRDRVEGIGLYHDDEKGLFEVHRGSDDPSLRDVADRHEEGTRHRFLHLNTWLAGSAGSRAVRVQRARDIGRFIRSGGFDIVGLNEVYDASVARHAPSILHEHAGTDRYERTTGPVQGLLRTNSGNQTLVRTDGDRRVVDHAVEPFDSQSKGGSFWVKYGINHTEIDLGPGNVDLVVTKLQPDGSGGGSYTPYDDNRLDQAREVARYVDRHSPPENVAIVAGDMNVPTRPHHGMTNFDEFLRIMDGTANLEDVFLRRGGKAAGTIGIHKEKNCDVPGPPGGNGRRPCYCSDYTDTDGAYSAQRLDYVFVQRPSTAHDVHLDVSRVRRRAMRRSDRCIQRPSDGAGKAETLLSDHAGLEMTLIASENPGWVLDDS